MTYYLTIETRAGNHLEYEKSFDGLDDALAFIDENYLAIPASATRNNAYICLYKGKITNLILGGFNCGLQDQWLGRIKTIKLQDEKGRAASAKYQATQTYCN